MYLISDGGLSCNTSNTKEAILLTKNIDYIDGVKLNVYETLDHVFVLAMDNDLSKYTFSNKKISECTYQYLRKVKFFSHVFKYYIPTLEEILKNYNQKKIIVLKLNIHCQDKLADLLKEYPYDYYFYLDDSAIIDNNLLKLGEVVHDIFIIDKSNYEIITKDNTLYVSKYPEKI